MKSLYELFGTQIPKWSYYSVEIIPANLFSISGDEAHANCEKFISDHFLFGSKESVLDTPFRAKYKDRGKHEHTVSLYLIGLLFQGLFLPMIKEDLKAIGINDADWYRDRDFMYTWYLSCLYHDAASCVEKIEDQIFPCCNYCIVRGAMPYTGRTIFNRKRSRYSMETIKKYCHYRICGGARDHGIHGGTLLYKKLTQNFRQKTRYHSWSDEPVCTIGELEWRREHLDHFRYIADAIICHNMWTVQETDTKGVENYKKYHLDELIVHSDADKLSIKEYPLQFMLCLLDTIEPVKRFEQLTARGVLENISIEPSGSRIRIAWTEKIKQQPEFWKWMENISNMKNWMQVDVSPCRQEGEWCYVTIDIR